MLSSRLGASSLAFIGRGSLMRRTSHIRKLRSRVLSSAEFMVGNTYNRLNEDDAQLDRTNTRKKIHDWSLYVDVVNDSDPDLIQNVEFDLGPTFKPQTFVCSSPIPVARPDNSKAWRFYTRQQSFGNVSKRKANIKINGSGGTILSIPTEIILGQSKKARQRPVHTFVEENGKRALPMLALPKEQLFGIELELTWKGEGAIETVASVLENQATGSIQVHSYQEGIATSDTWKMVPDSSIQCSPSQPDCKPFELVSPILQAIQGSTKSIPYLSRSAPTDPVLMSTGAWAFIFTLMSRTSPTMNLSRFARTLSSTKTFWISYNRFLGAPEAPTAIATAEATRIP
mmetsp:Transcript_4142/g.11296  ORF Transcript_4142/g.11296 Transcript_4142/m.11296 type:complete len:342 (-) Transcript_4142:648-1673(-)